MVKLKSLVSQPSWQSVLANEWQKPYLKQLESFLTSELEHKTILPSQSNWFNCINSVPFQQVKVVILGQDPYPNIGDAHGLSFSIENPQQKLPKSLFNIFKELETDLGINHFQNGNLQGWANQGVLLLNSVLTLEAGKPHSHQKQGWETFTDKIIQQLSAQIPYCVFILWGKPAQAKLKLIDTDKHGTIISPHPSPLSAYRGFWNSKPFSKTNILLTKKNMDIIDWKV
jgi:uracil-DNA glycosylase